MNNGGMIRGRVPDENEAEWRSMAACADMDGELFFPKPGGPGGGTGTGPNLVHITCAGCPSRLPCLAYSLDPGERFGIWGGLGEKERRPLRRRAVRAGVVGGGATAMQDWLAEQPDITTWATTVTRQFQAESERLLNRALRLRALGVPEHEIELGEVATG